MSNLLEQAIVDATALREVAMKNAEAALIEKYSKEFKQSIEKLLEQEEAPAIPDAAIANPTAPSAAPAISGPATNSPEKEKVFSKVKSSFLENNDEDEKMVTIDFNELKKQLSGGSIGGLAASPQTASPLLSTPETAPAPAAGLAEKKSTKGTPLSKVTDVKNKEKADLDDDDFLTTYEKKRAKAIEASMEDEDESQEEDLEESFEIDEKLNDDIKIDALTEDELDLEENEEELEEDVAEDKLIDPKKKKNGPVKRVDLKEEENIEISAEELKELAEMLTVDVDASNLSDGHMGSIARDKRDARNLEFAQARTEKEVARRKEEDEAMSDLKDKLDEALELGIALADENEELKEKLTEMYGHLDNLKENLEKLSVSNAKLLYTNKVLGNTSLNERQKEQIVENISKSTSVLEAKTIYNTLQSTVSGITQSKPKESLSEALNRGNSPFITRKVQGTELPIAERMKLLAGITKK